MGHELQRHLTFLKELHAAGYIQHEEQCLQESNANLYGHLIIKEDCVLHPHVEILEHTFLNLSSVGRPLYQLRGQTSLGI